MAHKKFSMKGDASSDNPSAIKPALERIIANKGTIRETDQGFEVEAELEGESAQSLNRMLLSELRRAEKRTRFRSEWTSGDTSHQFYMTYRPWLGYGGEAPCDHLGLKG